MDWATMGVYKQELYKFVYDFIGTDAALTAAKDSILAKIADPTFVLDHATVSALERTDTDGNDLGNTSQQVLGLLAAQFAGDTAIEEVLTPIQNSLSDLCDGASCEVDENLVGKTNMAKAFKFITESMVIMGESDDFDDTTTIDNELIVSYNYATDGAVDPSGLHDFTRENLFDEPGPTASGNPIFTFASVTGDNAKADMDTDFNAAKRTAEGYNMDQQLMHDFLTARV